MKSIVKNIIAMLRAKSISIRDKTNMLKARLVVLSLLRNKKFSLSSISHKIEAILNHKHEDADVTEDVDHTKSIVLYNASVPTHDHYYEYYYDDKDKDKYPDLRHNLFGDEDEGGDDVDLGDANGSVTDLMRDSKEDFNLEDEIDHAADLFILKFHKRMKLQKLESFKRYQEMLQRGA